MPKMTIHYCHEHDNRVVELDGEIVCSNDYSIENLRRLASHLNWEVEDVEYSAQDFEEKFA